MNNSLIYYDYMLPPKAVKMNSHKLGIRNYVINPEATDGHILLGWDEIRRLSQIDLCDLVYVLSYENSVYRYNAENKKEYITDWIEFSNLFVNARNDSKCDYSDYFVQDERFFEAQRVEKDEMLEREDMFYDARKGPKAIRLVSEILQLDKYIEQNENNANISFTDLVILENSKLFDKVLFCCEDSVYSYFLSSDDSKPERKIDWNKRWWNVSDVVLVDSEKDIWKES